MADKFIQGMHMKKGALHQEMGVPMKNKIPVQALEKAKNSNNPTLAKRANLALEFRGFNKGKDNSDPDNDND